MHPENKFVFVISTFWKRHIYLEETIKICYDHFSFIDHFIIVTDKDWESYLPVEVIVVNDKSWLNVLQGGLEIIHQKYNPEYVFLMLEDLLPLQPIEEAVFLKHAKIAFENNIKHLSFRTYDYDVLKYEHLLDGVVFCKIHQEYLYYSQLQPAFWKLEYLMIILKNLKALNNHSPWHFEFHKSEEVHLISPYRWPSLLGGTIEAGIVNRKIFKHLKTKNLFRLRKILFLEYLGETPKFYWNKIVDKIKRTIRTN